MELAFSCDKPVESRYTKKATEEDLLEVTASQAAVNEIRSGQILLQQQQLHQEVYRLNKRTKTGIEVNLRFIFYLSLTESHVCTNVVFQSLSNKNI